MNLILKFPIRNISNKHMNDHLCSNIYINYEKLLECNHKHKAQLKVRKSAFHTCFKLVSSIALKVRTHIKGEI